MEESSKSNFFPRSSTLPNHSPKYWARNKDRFLRQLLVSDIEKETERPLVVYFASANESINGHDASINRYDVEDLYEVTKEIKKSKEIDLFLQTFGGDVDATEKIINFLRERFRSYRVVVPNWAKSGGTMIALAAEKIIMGTISELGPIDPQYDGAPCELLKDDKDQPSHFREEMRLTVERAKNLAQEYLEGKVESGKLKNVVEKIASPYGYGSHAAAIDFHEAKEIGLHVHLLKEDDPLWQKIWFLYCLYDVDMRNSGLARICETIHYSITRLPPLHK